jgi:hypothetical protein
MPLPCKRRIARAALLMAAVGPVIGMGAATASAAEHSHATDQGGLSALDTPIPLGKDIAPAAIGLVGNAGKNAAPITKEATGSTGTAPDQVTGRTSTSLLGGGLVSSALPVHTSQVPQTADLAQRGLQTLQGIALQQLLLHGMPNEDLPLG